MVIHLFMLDTLLNNNIAKQRNIIICLFKFVLDLEKFKFYKHNVWWINTAFSYSEKALVGCNELKVKM